MGAKCSGGYLEVGCLMNYAFGGYLSHYYQWRIPLQKEQEEEKFDNKEFIRRLLDRCECLVIFLIHTLIYKVFISPLLDSN